MERQPLPVGRICPRGARSWGSWAPQTEDLFSKPPAPKRTRPLFELVNLPPAPFVTAGHLLRRGAARQVQELVNPETRRKLCSVFWFFLARDPNILHILKGVCNTLTGSKLLFQIELDLFQGLPCGPQGLLLRFLPPSLCDCQCRAARSPFHSPRPLRPTKRRSLNLATWFFMTAEALRSSAE